MKLGRALCLAVIITVLFGYALKTGKCATHEQQLKNQREAIERTARLLAELEQKIKKTNQKEPSKPQQTRAVMPRVGTKNDKNEEDEKCPT